MLVGCRCWTGDLRALADGLQFGINQAFVIQPDALQVGPQALLDVQRKAFQRAGEIGVLAAHSVAIVGVHQGGAMLEAALQIGHAAQELNLVLLQLVLPLEAPVGPVIADVLQFLGDLLLRGDAVAEL